MIFWNRKDHSTFPCPQLPLHKSQGRFGWPQKALKNKTGMGLEQEWRAKGQWWRPGTNQVLYACLCLKVRQLWKWDWCTSTYRSVINWGPSGRTLKTIPAFVPRPHLPWVTFCQWPVWGRYGTHFLAGFDLRTPQRHCQIFLIPHSSLGGWHPTCSPSLTHLGSD